MARLNVEGLRQYAEELRKREEVTPVQNSKIRSFGGVQPVGQLGEMLDRYEAPQDVRAAIARRAGGIIGSSGISHAFVEQAIQESMSADGLPRWDNVKQQVGKIARDVYKSKNKRLG